MARNVLVPDLIDHALTPKCVSFRSNSPHRPQTRDRTSPTPSTSSGAGAETSNAAGADGVGPKTRPKDDSGVHANAQGGPPPAAQGRPPPTAQGRPPPTAQGRPPPAAQGRPPPPATQGSKSPENQPPQSSTSGASVPSSSSGDTMVLPGLFDEPDESSSRAVIEIADEGTPPWEERRAKVLRVKREKQTASAAAGSDAGTSSSESSRADPEAKKNVPPWEMTRRKRKLDEGTDATAGTSTDGESNVPPWAQKVCGVCRSFSPFCTASCLKCLLRGSCCLPTCYSSGVRLNACSQRPTPQSHLQSWFC